MASHDPSASGMSVLELLLSITMLVVFTGVVASVMQVTLRIAGEAECTVDDDGNRRCNIQTTKDAANGPLIDRQRIEILFDQLEQVLVQPGINVSRIESISGSLDSPPDTVCTLNSSTSIWNDSIPEIPLLTFPSGYHICLWQTDAQEPSMSNLLKDSAYPGLYVLQALPTRLSAANLPVRRLICRPRPFC